MNIKDSHRISPGRSRSRHSPPPGGRLSLVMVGLGVACVIGVFAVLALLYALN